MNVATNEHYVASSDVSVNKTKWRLINRIDINSIPLKTTDLYAVLIILTCVGLAFNFGKLMFDGFN